MKIYVILIISIFSFVECKIDSTCADKLIIYDQFGFVEEESAITCDSIRDGITTKFYQGKKILKLQYKMGILNGHKTVYYNSGRIKEEGSYLNGHLHGYYKFKSPTGKVDSILTYINSAQRLKIEYYNGKPSIIRLNSNEEIGNLVVDNQEVNGILFLNEIWQNRKKVRVIYPMNFDENYKFISTFIENGVEVNVEKVINFNVVERVFQPSSALGNENFIVNSILYGNRLIFIDTIR